MIEPEIDFVHAVADDELHFHRVGRLGVTKIVPWSYHNVPVIMVSRGGNLLCTLPISGMAIYYKQPEPIT